MQRPRPETAEAGRLQAAARDPLVLAVAGDHREAMAAERSPAHEAEVGAAMEHVEVEGEPELQHLPGFMHQHCRGRGGGSRASMTSGLHVRGGEGQGRGRGAGKREKNLCDIRTVRGGGRGEGEGGGEWSLQ